jgi:hypothetical protein
MHLENAILETLAYSDIFDFPLNIDELHRYLVAPAEPADLAQCLADMDKIGFREGYYFLSGRDEIVSLRKAREPASRRAYQRAVFYGRMLGSLPFVRMVALTGSLAVMNLSKGADIDYMIVTKPGHLWTARAFSVIFGRIMRPLGYTICVNLLVSENALAWPLHDLYSAREMCQMIPVRGMDVYRRLRAANSWTQSILPNSAFSAPNLVKISSSDEPVNQIQRLLEWSLDGKSGGRIEKWAQKLQRQHIVRRFGNGRETNFTADVCQGNFHHHRHSAGEYFQARLATLGLTERAREFAEASSS